MDQISLLLFGSVPLVAIAGWYFATSGRRERARREEQMRQLAFAAQYHAQQQAYWDALCRQFGPENAARVLRGDIRVGDTMDMVNHAFGQPHDVQEKTTARKRVQMLRWFVPGFRNRIAKSIRLTNGIVDSTEYL